MIHIVIEVDDHPSWEECTKEAVAELLTDLGGVRVVDVHTDKPEQLEMADDNEYADIAFDHSEQQCVIWYNKDGDGWMSRVEYIPESNQIDLTWSDRWKIGGDPQNICAAYDSFGNFACVCSTILPSGSSNENQRYAVLDEMCVSASGAVVDPTPYALTPENCPCLYGIDYATSPTAGGWDIAYATNWYYDLMARRASGDPNAEITDDDVAAFIVHISYPKKEEGGRGLITVEHNAEMELHARNYVETTAPGYSSGDTVAIDVGATTGELGYVSSWQHTGIVDRVVGGRVYLVEGNTSPGNKVVANGGMVCEKSYPLGDKRIYGYGRPWWDQVVKEMNAMSDKEINALVDKRVKEAVDKAVKPLDDALCKAIQELTPKVFKHFADVPGYWRNEIAELVDAGAIRGNGMGELNLTETEAKVLAVVARLMVGETYNTVDECPEWSREAVQWAVDSGVIQGIGGGKLNLNAIKIWLLQVEYNLSHPMG